MDNEEILKLITSNKDSFVQIIKAKHNEFYKKINFDFTGKSFSEKLYRYLHKDDISIGKCKLCGLDVRFGSFTVGFVTFCSKKCANINNAPLRSGPRPINMEYWEEVSCLNCNVKFFALKFRNQKYCSNKCSSSVTANDPERLKKIKNTKLERYGTQSYVNPYKAKETCLVKYGVINPGQIESVKEKIRITFLKNYLIKLKTSERLKGLVIPLFDESRFISTFRSNIYPFQCKKCNNIFDDNLDDGRIPRCLICFPILSGKSNGELEIVNYIKEICSDDIILNSRSICKDRRELDIYIPSKNIAIEYDGLFWHSEIGGNKNYNYHLKKTEDCKNSNILLIHIFEDEWVYKQEIVKNRLKYLIGSNSFIKIHARKCNTKEIKYSDIDIFMENNHIQGNIKSPINIGLFHNNELVSAMSCGNLRYSLGSSAKENEYELLRFSTKNGYNVRGSFSKLFSFFVKQYSPDRVITYSDLRWGNGEVYKKSNFTYIDKTSPNYWYIKNGDINRLHRFSFRKSELLKKLKTFDPLLSEWENMQLNGYDRIWDCGNLKYEWNKNIKS